MAEGIDIGGLTHSVEEESTSEGGRDYTRKPKVDVPDESVARLLVDLLTNDDGDLVKRVEIFAFAEDARENDKVVNEAVREHYGLSDSVETLSWEDIFGVDCSEFQFVGYPPRDRSGSNTTYKDGWTLSDFSGDILGDTKTLLNGHHCDVIQSGLFGEEHDCLNPGGIVAISSGRTSRFDDDFEKAKKFVEIRPLTTDKARETAIDNQVEAGRITESEAEEAKRDAGLVEEDDEPEEDDDSDTDGEETGEE